MNSTDPGTYWVVRNTADHIGDGTGQPQWTADQFYKDGTPVPFSDATTIKALISDINEASVTIQWRKISYKVEDPDTGLCTVDKHRWVLCSDEMDGP